MSNEVTKSVQWLRSSKDRILAMLPQGVAGERWLANVEYLMGSDEKLRKCRHESIFSAVLQGAEMGLSFNGSLQEAHLVPFGAECKLMVGYRGLRKMIRQGDREVGTIECRIVYTQDELMVEDGKLCWHADITCEERTKVKGAFCKITYMNGSEHWDYMTLAELEKVRATSKMKNSMPWKDFTTEMYRKTVLRRVAKQVPLSVECEQAITSMDESEGFDLEVQGKAPAQGNAATLAAIQPQERVGVSKSEISDYIGQQAEIYNPGEELPPLSEEEQADLGLEAERKAKE